MRAIIFGIIFRESSSRGQLFGGQFSLGAIVRGAIIRKAIIRGVIIWGAIVRGAIFLGGNCPDTIFFFKKPFFFYCKIVKIIQVTWTETTIKSAYIYFINSHLNQNSHSRFQKDLRRRTCVNEDLDKRKILDAVKVEY